ncbi:Synerg-CTERM sorting domain-containing protein, partial [uncultured Fretibacterium sp.]|uniref:Synerg-CTERM sorting domain-containing protein n=1 Tax=uncultured Fretibacterium sp. TaxID=1678694 RepID=UPI0026297D64
TSISWNSTAPIGNTSLSNIRKMVSLNGFLYGISYGNNPYGGQPSDVAQVRRFDMNNSYASGTASFSYNPSTGQGHGEGLVAYNNYLYAILTETRGSYPFTYAPNKLIKLNSTNLSVAGYPVNLSGKNTDGGTHGAYCQNGATLYLTSWGGSQPTDTSYNPESQVERVNLENLENLSHSTLVTGRQMRARDATWNHHFTAVVINGKDAYIQATTWNRLGGGGGQVRLYKTKASSIGSLGPGNKIKSLDTGDGWRVGMIVDGKYLYVAAGKKLYRYTMPVKANSTATVFGPGGTSLGGDISSFAAVPSLRGVSVAQAAMEEPVQAMAAKDEKDGGSGCDAGFGWLLLLAVIPVALRRRG